MGSMDIEKQHIDTYLPRVHQVNNVRHVFLLPDGITAETGDDIFAVDSKKLGKGCSCKGVRVGL
jgi:hypothetical protein